MDTLAWYIILAKQGYKYSDKGAWESVDRLTEAFQYYLLRASCNPAEEKGKCDGFERTKYADGLLPIDHYKKEVDEIVPTNNVWHGKV